MTDGETTIFNQTYNLMPWSRCRVKFGRAIVETATCSGIDAEREDTDYGKYNMLTGEVRFRKADEPEAGINVGDQIEVELHDRGWRKARIGGIGCQGAITKLILEAAHA